MLRGSLPTGNAEFGQPEAQGAAEQKHLVAILAEEKNSPAFRFVLVKRWHCPSPVPDQIPSMSKSIAPWTRKLFRNPVTSASTMLGATPNSTLSRCVIS